MRTTNRLTHVAEAAVAALFTCEFAIPALSGGCPELTGRWPYGSTWAVAVSGGHAYYSNGTALMVADVSDPAAPQAVGETVVPDQPQVIAVSAGYAYVADWRGGLRVIDVSDPAAPIEVAFLDTPGQVARDVAVSGSYAYVTAGYHGLLVIDVSTPSAPVEDGVIDTPYWASGIAVDGGYAYVAEMEFPGAGGSLRVIDISTPSTPVEVGFVDTPGRARAVAVAGGYAYVADDSAGLRVIDVSTPSAPVEVGFVDTPGNAWGIAVSGGHAYVADDSAGLRVIDVSTPSAPLEVGVLDTPGRAGGGIAVAAGFAYLADGFGGLRVIDVSTPSAPADVSFLESPGAADGIAVEGGYAYVGFRGSPDVPGTLQTGVRVYDVTDPSAPLEIGFVDTPGEATDIAISGGHAYVADSGEGLRVVDVSTPSAPVELGSVDTTGPARGVAVARGHAYVAASGSGLQIIDVSAPAAPLEVGFFDTPGYAVGVGVSGGYAFVADTSSLRVIDVSTASAPVEVGFINPSGSEQDVAVSGRYAYLANGVMGLRIVDVSTPSAPVEVGAFDPPGTAQFSSVAVARGYVYISELDPQSVDGDYPTFLRVIDVSTPSLPVEVGSVEISAWQMTDVALSGGQVFVTGGEGGWYVFAECGGDPIQDGRECFIPAAAVAAGAQGAFFQTDVEINNTGTEEAEVWFNWLPRGEDNSEPVGSESIALAPGQSLRWENVLTELFGLEPDSLGALKLMATTESVIGMSRTYNVPGAKAAGTFGQGLPAIRATEMIVGTEPQRIIFLSEDPDSRANVGCVNGTDEALHINIELFDDEGTLLESKTMDLGPYSNDQINRIFEDWAPVNGYVDVWADRDDALYYCYGSMLDNLTSDPTTILPQVPSADVSFIPAAALAAGLEGSFFQTDIDLNNVGSTDLTYELLWLPRGADNSDPVRSDTFSLAPGAGVRYANVLDEVFGLEPDQVGALAIEASGTDLLAMSRTYNLPSAKVAGTFGQELPGIPADRMIPTGVKKRIIFMSENDDVRANVGCINGAGIDVAVAIELYDSDGAKLETKYMMLPPYSNRQVNGIFQDYAPINGYVDIRTYTPDALIYCYGSVLDNLTSDPTTVLPQ
jgi:hypothetical protein